MDQYPDMSEYEAQQLIAGGLVNRDTGALCDGARQFGRSLGLRATAHASDLFRNSTEYHAMHRRWRDFRNKHSPYPYQQQFETFGQDVIIDSFDLNKRPTATNKTTNQFNPNTIFKDYNSGHLPKINQKVKSAMANIDWDDKDMHTSSKNGYHKNVYDPLISNSSYSFGIGDKCYSNDEFLFNGDRYELLSRYKDENGEIRWKFSINGLYKTCNIMKESEIIDKMGKYLTKRLKIGLNNMQEISHGMTLISPENNEPYMVWSARSMVNNKDYIMLVDSENNCFEKYKMNTIDSEGQTRDAVLLLSKSGYGIISTRNEVAEYFNFGGYTCDTDSLQSRKSNMSINKRCVYGFEVQTKDELFNPFQKERIKVLSTGGGKHSNLYVISGNGSRIRHVKYDFFSVYQFDISNNIKLSVNTVETLSIKHSNNTINTLSNTYITSLT